MPEINSAAVEALSRDNKRILIAGTWYGSFTPLSGISKGDVVSFTYVQKGQWNNIKGAVELVASGGNPSASRGGPAPTTSSPAPQAASTVPYYDRNAGFLTKTFPVPANHPDRAIIRQNSITNAIRALSETQWIVGEVENMSHDDIFASVMSLATKFEKYATGDLEKEMAEEMVSKKESK